MFSLVIQKEHNITSFQPSQHQFDALSWEANLCVTGRIHYVSENEEAYIYIYIYM